MIQLSMWMCSARLRWRMQILYSTFSIPRFFRHNVKLHNVKVSAWLRMENARFGFWFRFCAQFIFVRKDDFGRKTELFVLRRTENTPWKVLEIDVQLLTLFNSYKMIEFVAFTFICFREFMSKTFFLKRWCNNYDHIIWIP